VNTEHPTFITIGFLLMILGFGNQFFAVPPPSSIGQLREQIRLLKAAQKRGAKKDK
jgi:hypothetical protein